MARLLTFEYTPRGKECFALVYQGFVFGGNQAQGKGMELLRREAKILDAFHAISDRPTDLPADIEGVRILKPGTQEVRLEVPDYELVRRYFESVSWKTSVAPAVVAVADWLAEVPPAPEVTTG